MTTGHCSEAMRAEMGSMLTGVFKGAARLSPLQTEYSRKIGGWGDGGGGWSLAPSAGLIGIESEITHGFNYTSQRGERVPLDGRGGNVGGRMCERDRERRRERE